MSAPPSSNATTLPTTGDVIDGKYVLERLLGQGGMGAVYAARHRKLGHAVAIKVMLADAANHEAASRFVNEGRAAANIQNEHVVRVSDVDEENGYAYMVLELLEGEDLSQVLERERRLPPNVAVSYVCQALDGVRQAHAQGIVHRDLKPSNLFLARRQDGSTVIKVLDFGISKANSSNPLGAAPGALTSTKAMLGSPLYMSPEQLRSSKSVDARADIWAVGVILYELITGKLPFMGENLGELFAQILEVEAPPLRLHVPEAPQGVEAIVARCLQRRPEHRFQNVAELERELAPYAGGTSASPFATSAQAAMPHTAMMATPPLAGVHAALAAARASGQQGMAQTPQGMAPMAQHAPPPNGYPGPPRPGGSITGSGAHAPVVKGTAPIGAITPQPHQQTDGAWQSTGSTSKGASTALTVGAGVAFLALIGLGVVGYSYSRPKPHDLPPVAGSASAGTASVASADVPPVVPTASGAAPVPEPTVAAATDAGTVAQVVASAKPPAGTGPRRPPPPVVVARPADPPPARPDPPRPADPPVPTKKPPTSVQQNER
ncbi:MAG TPA: serine/threonine-protein kinase [Labilithrix sp.]|nr:serine/threonine-protein kinase [Labilithrix sp.]